MVPDTDNPINFVIDGKVDEWGTLGTGSLYYMAPMCNEGNCAGLGNADMIQYANAYGHWDCASRTLYVLVYSTDPLQNNFDLSPDNENTWMKVAAEYGMQGSKLTGVMKNICYDVTTETTFPCNNAEDLVVGWEAKFTEVGDPTSENCLYAQVHINLGGATVSTGKPNQGQRPIDLTRCSVLRAGKSRVQKI